MAENVVGVKFERDGICIWVKIGEHCKALIYPPEEDRLREWLEAAALSTAGVPKTLDLKASRVTIA